MLGKRWKDLFVNVVYKDPRGAVFLQVDPHAAREEQGDDVAADAATRPTKPIAKQMQARKATAPSTHVPPAASASPPPASGGGTYVTGAGTKIYIRGGH